MCDTLAVRRDEIVFDNVDKLIAANSYRVHSA
jgi:hypothetical protein